MPAQKLVLITGANKGVGLATVAAVLSASGDTSVLLGSRDLTRGEAARKQLVGEQPSWAERIKVIGIDVGDDDSVKAAAESVSSRFDSDSTPLFGIINNAGVGATDMTATLNVNTRGPKRVCDAFLPLLETAGRIVNISSASGPNFVSGCSAERQAFFTNPEVTWAQVDALMNECLELDSAGGDFEAAGLGNIGADGFGGGYGLSKACLNSYTAALSRAHPTRLINACTPGFIETDMTRPYAEAQGVAPKELGMSPPDKGTRAALHLLFGEPGGSGWYFGSDAQRSPLDRYRSPGDPPFTG